MKIRMPYALVSLLLLLAPSMMPAQPASDEVDLSQYIPAPDEVVWVEKEPGFDMAQLRANILYPPEALEKNLEGRVVVRVLIDREGRPSRAIVIKSDDAVFDSAAIAAVEKTTFTPAIRDAQPASVWMMTPVRFVPPESD